MVARVSNTAFASPFDVDPFGATEEELEGEQLQLVEPVEEEEEETISGYTPTVYTQVIRSQDYGSTPEYETPEEALENYMSLYNRVQGQMAQTDRVYNYNNYDPGDFARMGYSGPRSVSQEAGSDALSQYLMENNIPPSITVDGQTLYFTSGLGEDVLNQILGDDYRASGSYEALGPVGTYSTVYQPRESALESFLTNPIVGLAASFVPFGTLALTGAQLAADVDVNPLQAASGLLQGLQLAGVVRPPSAPLAEGLQGPPDVGEGLFGTTYAQTESLITAASAGNVEEAAMGMFGGQLVNEGLAQAGIAPETLGLTQQELTSGVNTTVNALAQGAELDEALAEGFGRQLVEGVVDAIPTGDAPSLGFIEDAIRPIVEPVIDAVEQIAEPFVEVVEQVGPQIEDAIRAGGEALEPIVEPIVDTASAIGSPVEDIVREVGPPIEDAVREMGEALEPVGQLLGEVVDLGDISRGYSMPRGAVMGVPQRTQIENLFDRELFQFEEEIGISPEYLELFGLPDNIEFYEADGTIIPVSTEPRVYSF